MNRDAAKQAILDYIKTAGGSATFVDVMRVASDYVEVKGECELYLGGVNVVLWAGMSEILSGIMSELLSDKQYRLVSRLTSVFTYSADGMTLDLPIAKKPSKTGYKTKHWLPVCLLIADDKKLNKTIDFLDYVKGINPDQCGNIDQGR